MLPLRLPLAWFIYALSISAALAAEPVFPPGSHVGLVPPAGMTAATRFQGFEDRALGATLVVTELSAQSYERVAQEFGDEQMRAGGMVPVTRETIETPGGPALLIVARQTENGVAIRKWALLARAADLTAIVVATLPEAARSTYPDTALRAALASTVIRAKISADEMLAVLPYRLTELGGFRLLRATPDGTATLTFGPGDTTLPVEQPYFMMALRGAESPPPSERDRFAQRMLAAFLSRPDLRVVSSETLRIGGAQAHEIVAESEDIQTKDSLMIVQWLRFEAGGVVQMFGMARKDQWAAVLPRMRALRDGFARR
jgi:hypothetical protein